MPAAYTIYVFVCVSHNEQRFFP